MFIISIDFLHGMLYNDVSYRVGNRFARTQFYT